MRHGLRLLLHEKPFAGINGSGKHSNWSWHLADRQGREPARAGHDAAPEPALPRVPRRRPEGRAQARATCCAPASPRSGNDHRLGANEAPPAIISVFLGDLLDALIDEHRRRKEAGQGADAAARSSSASAKLPEVAKDNTDRNRTSPFAFTGNKFEFRAVGSSQSIALPDHDAQRGGGRGDRRARRISSRETLKRTKNAQRGRARGRARGVQGDQRRPLRGQQLLAGVGGGGQEARPASTCVVRPKRSRSVTTKNARTVLTKLDILTKAEIDSRYHVQLERYIKDMLIELHTLVPDGGHDDPAGVLRVPRPARRRGVEGEVGRHQPRCRRSRRRTRWAR